MNGALFLVGVVCMMLGIMFSLPGMGGGRRGHVRARGIGVFSGPINLILIAMDVVIMAGASILPG